MQICFHIPVEKHQHSLRFFGLLIFLLVSYRLGMGAIPLFDWDEINFAEVTREMILSDNWLQPTVNFLPFHEKTPLFFWLQGLSFQLFGIHAWSARLPNLLAAFFTLPILYLLGRRLHNPRFAWWWMAFYGLSLLPQLYFRSGIIDPWFNLFIFLGVWLLVTKDGELPKPIQLLGSGLLLGLAILTKGPAAGLIMALLLLVRLVFSPGSRLKLSLRYALVGLLALVPIGIWLWRLWQLDDGFFAKAFLDYQWRLFFKEDAGHGGFPGYHFVVLLFGCFPASIFALPWVARRKAAGPAAQYVIWMRQLLWVVLILFTIVNTKIVHYSSLAYFPLTFLAAWQIEAWAKKGTPLPKWASAIGLFVWTIAFMAFLSLPFITQYLLPYLGSTDLELQSRQYYGGQQSYYSLLAALPLLCCLVLLFRYHQKLPTFSRFAGTHLILAALFTAAGLYLATPRIQAYSQGALIEFFQDRATQDVYVGTAYHKSYAPLFYAAIQAKRGGQEREWRFHGEIDADLYFSSPLRRTEQVLREVPDAELLYQKGGYSFYLRRAKHKPE